MRKDSSGLSQIARRTVDYYLHTWARDGLWQGEEDPGYMWFPSSIIAVGLSQRW